MTAKKGLEGEVVRAMSRTQKNPRAEALQVNQRIQNVWEQGQSAVTELGALFARMKEERLWQYLPGNYRRWEDYVEAVLGPRARSTVYEILAAHTLTQGSNPIPADMVNRMGVKKAYQLLSSRGQPAHSRFGQESGQRARRARQKHRARAH